MPRVHRLEHGVARARGGDGDDRAVGHDAAVVLDDLLDRVEHRHAVDLATLAARGHAADDLRAVVEALAREVDGLAPGDALDDEGRVLVDKDAHQINGLPHEFAGQAGQDERARPPRVAYYIRVRPLKVRTSIGKDADPAQPCGLMRRPGSFDRTPCGLPQRHGAVAVLDPVLVEDLEALLLPGAGDAEDRDRLAGILVELQAGLDHAARDDVHARVGDDRHHHGDLLDAVFLENLLGQAAGLGDGRVAADLGVVGGLAALLAHGVGERQRAAARADHEADVAVEAGVLALDHAAMVGGVDRLDGLLERGRGVALAGALLRADAQRLEQALLARHALVLHLHVRVERDERAVLQLRQRVDLGERHVVVEEQPGPGARARAWRAAGPCR